MPTRKQPAKKRAPTKTRARKSSRSAPKAQRNPSQGAAMPPRRTNAPAPTSRPAPRVTRERPDRWFELALGTPRRREKSRVERHPEGFDMRSGMKRHQRAPRGR
jgi:hypothetical protein